jgi:hypothetical protein
MFRSSADSRAWAVVLKHAREVHVETDRVAVTVPIDRRCPSCGVARDGCDRPFCNRLMSEAEA